MKIAPLHFLVHGILYGFLVLVVSGCLSQGNINSTTVENPEQCIAYASIIGLDHVTVEGVSGLFMANNGGAGSPACDAAVMTIMGDAIGVIVGTNAEARSSISDALGITIRHKDGSIAYFVQVACADKFQLHQTVKVINSATNGIYLKPCDPALKTVSTK